MVALLLFLAASPVPGVLARGFSQQPEDIYAWPKYKVSFLNGLPVLNHTAQRWLQDGLRGGEKEFLGLEWTPDSQSASSNLKSIDPGNNQLAMSTKSTDPLADVDPSDPSATPSLKLQHMRLQPSNEFLCLIMPPPEIPPYTDDTLQPPPYAHMGAFATPPRHMSLRMSSIPYFNSHAVSPDKLANAPVSIDKAGLPMPTVTTNTSDSFAKRNRNCRSVRLALLLTLTALSLTLPTQASKNPRKIQTKTRTPWAMPPPRPYALQTTQRPT
jgi:hypothetical protein